MEKKYSLSVVSGVLAVATLVFASLLVSQLANAQEDTKQTITLPSE